MINQDHLQVIKREVQEFFRKMGFEPEVAVNLVGGTVLIELRAEKPKELIGEGGRTLAEIQHLIKAVLKRKIEQPFYIDLDINGYKKKKFEYLKELARSMADEVALSKKEKVFPPMPAYERRIIHLELAGRQDVVTESCGQEPRRYLIIRAYP
jgi:spoIIIJ-associated protein